ncbi:hypothetical protein FA10DRAFT_225146, partial [Acaromyces ingoldii]
RYRLIVRQQPEQGRAGTFGSKERRPLDPLPIVQLEIFDKYGNLDLLGSGSPNLVMQVSALPVPIEEAQEEVTLEDKGGGESVEGMKQEKGKTLARASLGKQGQTVMQRVLEGKVTSSAHVAFDTDGSRACFFIFSDLSLRIEGTFKLVFSLVRLGMGSGARTSVGKIVATVSSDAFKVYSPREFPGVAQSTDLAKCLANQGVQIPIRNEARRGGSAAGRHIS